MFKNTNGNGIVYISKSGREYSLLNGITSNSLLSGIIFIFDYNNGVGGKVVNFVWADYEEIKDQEESLVNFIKNSVETYEKENNLVKELI